MSTAKNYIEEMRDSFPATDIVKENYYPQCDVDTDVEQKDYTPTLPFDSDVFSELPKDVYDNEDIKTFLNYLRKVISYEEYADIAFPKLHLTSHSETEVLLEWVDEHFRLYFSFDSDDGNYYGVIVKNLQTVQMFNYIAPLNKSQYEETAEKIIKTVVDSITGRIH